MSAYPATKQIIPAHAPSQAFVSTHEVIPLHAYAPASSVGRSLTYSSAAHGGASRLPGIAFVGLLHLGLIYALVTGLSHKSVPIPPTPLEVKLIQEAKPQDDRVAPPPPPKVVAAPPPFVPLPDINVREASPNAITVVSTVKPTAPVAPAVVREDVKSVIVPPVIDPSKTCEQPQYPLASREAGETGTVILLFLIDTDGHVLASKVEKSSDHNRLDEAALTALSKCRFVPGTVDGVPQQSKARLRYVWNIN